MFHSQERKDVQTGCKLFKHLQCQGKLSFIRIMLSRNLPIERDGKRMKHKEVMTDNQKPREGF